MRRASAVLLFLVFITLALTSSNFYDVVQASTEVSNITKPAVPEFTLVLVDSSYDVPTTYSIDPYTGENVTHSGYHVEDKKIGFKIKNQPFTSYYDDGLGQSVNFYYNIRFKGHFSEEWRELCRASDGYPHQWSDSEYTVLTCLSETGKTIESTGFSTTFPDGGQVDYQVEAMIGYVHRDASTTFYPWVFTGEKSGWSETLTVTVPISTQLPIITVSPANPPESTPSETSVPEFTLEYVDYSYDIPPETTSVTDPYTNETTTTTTPGRHVENKTIEATINNNIGASYYNFRYKGHYEEKWSYYPFDPDSFLGYSLSDTYSVPYKASNSDYTVAALPSVFFTDVPEGGLVDVQVQALFGDFRAVPYGHIAPLPAPTYDFYFEGTMSDWSNTQTIAVGENQILTLPGTTLTPNQELLNLGVATAAIVIGAGLLLLIYLTKRK